jgi:non-ribosomal peptide synthetase component E (peptide arylation enzyme)
LTASTRASLPPQVTGLGYVPLEPTAFLRRSARVFADRVAAIDDDATFTNAQFSERVDRIAGALTDLGVRSGDRVAVLAPNTHVMLALPMFHCCGWCFTWGVTAAGATHRYTQITDRSKDVIISGGENIASIELPKTGTGKIQKFVLRDRAKILVGATK